MEASRGRRARPCTGRRCGRGTCRGGQVEGDREVGGPLGGDDVDDHAGEAVDRVRGLPAAVAESRPRGGKNAGRPWRGRRSEAGWSSVSLALAGAVSHGRVASALRLWHSVPCPQTTAPTVPHPPPATRRRPRRPCVGSSPPSSRRPSPGPSWSASGWRCCPWTPAAGRCACPSRAAPSPRGCCTAVRRSRWPSRSPRSRRCCGRERCTARAPRRWAPPSPRSTTARRGRAGSRRPAPRATWGVRSRAIWWTSTTRPAGCSARAPSRRSCSRRAVEHRAASPHSGASKAVAEGCSSSFASDQAYSRSWPVRASDCPPSSRAPIAPT